MIWKSQENQLENFFTKIEVQYSIRVQNGWQKSIVSANTCNLIENIMEDKTVYNRNVKCKIVTGYLEVDSVCNSHVKSRQQCFK